jgi:DNA (cytosine-5)-methyltransferase 1
MFTLTAQDKHGVMVNEATIQNYRIRKLTPLECFRLQGFPDELFYKAKAVNSDSQLYKQAGNSVTVNVIYEIAKKF